MRYIIILDDDNREEHKDFLTSELQQAQRQYNEGMKVVRAARNRLVRKKELQDPLKKGDPQEIDRVVAGKTITELEVSDTWE